MSGHDVIIIGAGHNGLVCGNYLSRAGLKVCVLERRSLVGGASVTEEVWPGFKVSTAAHMMGLLQPRIILDLDLKSFGYEILTPPPTVHQIENTGPVVLWRETEALSRQFARFSRRDASAYPAYVAQLARLGPLFQRLMWEIPFDPGSMHPRNVKDILLFFWRNRGIVGMFHEMADILTMSAYDYLSRWFESDPVKTILGYYPAGGAGHSVSIHTKGTAYFLLRGHLRDNTTKAGGTGLMRGGMGTISQALAESGRRYGMEVRTGAEVQKIRVSDNRTEGVVLKSGEEIRARTVISNASARHTFLDLLDDRELPQEFLRDIRGFNGKATAFKVHLAVTGLPHFPGVAEEGLDAYPAQICIAPSLEYMEEAFRQVQQGSVSRRPYLTVQAPSAIDSGLAPPGRHLLSIYGGHVPSGDQSSEVRQEVLSNVLNTIAEYTPDLANSVVEAQVMLPSDYERVFGLPGGHPHHADLSLDQLFFRRPARRYANYTSPIRGLFLCSASTHPGGGVTGVPGYNAARVVLKSKRMRPA